MNFMNDKRGEKLAKGARHEEIIQIIKAQEIGTQEELAWALNQKGFEVTQATVSRDIRELKLTKVPDEKGKSRYAAPPRRHGGDGKYLGILKEGFVAMDVGQNILVIKTISGMAMAVAAALEKMDYPEMIGNIAGDDTIMCVMKNGEQARQVMGKIRHALSS